MPKFNVDDFLGDEMPAENPALDPAVAEEWLLSTFKPAEINNGKLANPDRVVYKDLQSIHRMISETFGITVRHDVIAHWLHSAGFIPAFLGNRLRGWIKKIFAAIGTEVCAIGIGSAALGTQHSMLVF